MKSYLGVILAVFGLSFLISSYAPDINQDILPTTSDQSQSIEVSLLSEKEQVEKVEIAELTETAEITTTVARASASTGNRGQSYTITKVTSNLVASPTYSDIYRTGRLVYAHNSSGLFGYLRNLRVGSSVTLTENGVTHTYTVAGIGHFTKVPYRNGENLVDCDASYNNCSSTMRMGMLVNNAMGHTLAMMTCDGGAGTPRRLIIFLN